MNTLVSMSAGRRPQTAQTCLDTLRLMDPWLEENLTVVVWAPNPFYVAPHARVLVRHGATRAQAHNTAMADYRSRTGTIPDRWLILDDDVVLCWGLFERLNAIMEADPDVWLLGAWNDGSERHPDGAMRGEARLVAGEIVQYGGDFCVGGAIQLWRKEAIETFGGYDEERPWLEDSAITEAVRASGHHACIARTVFGVILRDDNIDEGYRREQVRGFEESFARVHGGARYKWPNGEPAG